MTFLTLKKKNVDLEKGLGQQEMDVQLELPGPAAAMQG